jgi:hypothetical protein
MKAESFLPLMNELKKHEKLVTKPITICMNCPIKRIIGKNGKNGT